MGKNRGTKDMRYALLKRADSSFKPWEERHPGYGAGAIEAADKAISLRRISIDDEVNELTQLDNGIAEAIDRKRYARTQEDFDRAAMEELRLLERKEKVEKTATEKVKLKGEMEARKKNTEDDARHNMSETQIRKQERMERRERAIAAKKAAVLQGAASKVAGQGVAAVKKPVGVVKNVHRGRAGVAATEKRKKVVEKALSSEVSEKDQSCKHEELFKGICIACGVDVNLLHEYGVIEG